MKNLKAFSAISFAIIFIFASCTKTGNTGPQGATGPAGPDSVMHSPWVELAMTFDSVATATGDSVFSASIPAASITQTTLDSSLIIGYLGYIDANGATNVVNAAPYFNPELFLVGSVSITSFGVNWSGSMYRFIIVPGSLFIGNSIVIGGQTYTKTELSKMSYQAADKLLSTLGTKSPN